MKILPECHPRFLSLAGFFTLALLAAAGAAIATETPASPDRTWELKLADQPSGSFTESTAAGTDGNVTTKERMAMEINRLGSKVSITNETAGELAQRSMSGPSLSDREIEVLRMISGGKSNKEIAAGLFVAESTVKTHVATIYEKLRVTDRTEAVVRAIQRGIIRV